MPSHFAAATLIAADVRRRAWLSQTAAIRSRIVVPVSPYAASKLGAWSRPASARKRDGPPVSRRPRSATWVISSRSLARVTAT